jgi:hypothetical protein
MEFVDVRIARFAAVQHGIVSVAQMRSMGVTDRTRQRMLENGVLVRRFDGAYRIVGAPASWKGDLLAACWSGGTRAAASHRSGAALWGIGGGDEGIQELTCPRWRRVRHDGLVVHETKVLDVRDVTVLDHVPVTTVERTILDLGAVRSPATVERAMESALRKDLTTLVDLRMTVRRLGRQGRNGVGVLRRILDERDPDRRLSESDMEMLMVQVLRANGLPEPVLQHEVRYQGRFVARVDAAFVESRIALDYESFEWHTGKAALVRNSARRNALIGADWKPIAVTWDDLRTGGHRVCAEIVRSMRSAA